MSDHEARTPASNEALDQMFTAFSVMWAFAAIFHIWNQIPWPNAPYPPSFGGLVRDVFVVGAAVGVLRAPRATNAFLLLIAAQALHIGTDFPRVANHWFFTGIVDTIILTSAVWERLATGELDRVRFFQRFVPVVRFSFLIHYGAAAWAKLNWDFLDPGISCVTDTWFQIADHWLKWLPRGLWAQYVAIFGTVAIEVFIPIGLCVPRLRRAAVVVGLLFHYFISFTPALRVPDFASMLFTMYFLFLPEDFAARMQRRRQELADIAAEWMPTLTPGRVVGAFLGIWAFGALLRLIQGLLVIGFVFRGLRLMAFLVYGVVVIVWILLSLDPDPEDRPGLYKPLRFVHPVLYVFVALSFLNVLAPYLGLKTRTSLTMFSNLRTEDHRSNHLFMPQLYLTDHQLDVVRVESSSNEYLQMMADKKEKIPWFEFKYRAQQDPDTFVSYTRRGEHFDVRRVGADPELSEPWPWWQRRLLVFRSFPAEGPSRCDW